MENKWQMEFSFQFPVSIELGRMKNEDYDDDDDDDDDDDKMTSSRLPMIPRPSSPTTPLYLVPLVPIRSDVGVSVPRL